MKSAEDLQTLYRETVLDHSRRPRHFGRLADADCACQGHNPLCGDKVTIYLDVADERIEDIAFEATGCAISIASASIMAEAVAGGTFSDVQKRISKVMDEFVSSRDTPLPAVLGDMAALAGVRAYPSRIKCATLPWKTLQAGLSGQAAPVTTE